MPTSKVIRPAVFDETGEHVIPADADLNLDPVSSDPDNYIVRGSDGGAFLNGDGVLSNNGENLLKTDSADGKVTYSRSDAVSLINETVKPSIDKLEKKHDEDVDALQRSDARLQTGIDKVQAAADKAQAAADKAQASADKAAESARQADEDAAAAQCTATQALNDAADAKAAADRAQARADAAYDKASDAQCAADNALDKAQEAVDSLPEIADAHSSIVTAGDGIKVAQSKLGDHNVYQVGVKPAGADSGIKTGTDGVEVDLKSGGGLSKDNDGLGVDQQWLIDLIAEYCKDHTMFSQFKIVSALPDIASADVHTIYLIRQSGSSAADVGTKDSFEGWVIVSTENGVQKWEKIGYKTEVNLAGYVHKGSTVTLTGNTSGTGTVDANGNVVVNTTTSRAANADHAASADRATSADHAASADKTTGGTVSITGYVSGTGAFDRNGNVTVDVVANIKDTPYTYYVGKTNARDYWGKDENGNQWGSTKDHPFASLGYAINQSNSHVFPGNLVRVWISESGEYRDFSSKWALCMLSVTTETHVLQLDGVQAEIRTAYDINISNAASLNLHGITFRRCHIDSKSEAPDGVTFFRIDGGGRIVFFNGCRMITDSNNDDYNTFPFIDSDVSLWFVSSKGKPGLTLELAGTGTVQYGSFIYLGNNSGFGGNVADTDCPFLKIIAPSGTQARSCVFNTGRFCVVERYSTAYPNYRQYVDWDIADESKLVQVVLGGYAYLGLCKNPDKGQALPGHEVGTVPAGAVYRQVDY